MKIAQFVLLGIRNIPSAGVKAPLIHKIDIESRKMSAFT